jgi:hypothetical protein
MLSTSARILGSKPPDRVSGGRHDNRLAFFASMAGRWRSDMCGRHGCFRSKTEQPLPASDAGSLNQTVATPTPWLLVGGCAVIAVLLIGVDLGKYLFGPNDRAKVSDSIKQPASTIPSLALCTDGPCAPVRLKQGPEYVKEIGLGVGSEQPLMLQATSLVTVDRLRVAVDYSEYRSGWMFKTRAFIGEIKEPVKGKTERLQLIYPAVKANGGTK